jgi:sugar diacid utilization regulator
MPSLRVRDILQFGGLVDAKVAAGASGLDNFVESVSVLEVAHPQIARWVTRNELYVTSFYAIRDDVAMQKKVIETLARCASCGLVLCYLGQYVQRVDDEILRLCDELNFPLIVPRQENVPYVEIMTPIMGKLYKYKPELSALDYSNLSNEFFDLIIDETDIQTIYSKIARALGLTFSLFDIYYGCIYTNKDSALMEAERRYLQKNMNDTSIITSEDHYVYVDANDALNIIYLVKSKRNFFGYIVMLVKDQEQIARYLDLTSRLSLASCLIFNKKNRLAEMSDVQREEYLVNLLVWNFPSTEAAVRNGKNLDFDITGKNRVVVVNVNQFNFLQYDSEKQALTGYIKKWMLPSIVEMAREYSKNNIAAFRSDTILLLLENKDGDPPPDALCKKIIALFEKNGRSTVSIGLSDRYVSAADIPEAYNQAFHAAILGRQLYGENAVIHFEDIFYIYQIKSMAKQSKNLSFCKKLVQPVLEYDRAKGTNLMETFEKLVLLSADVRTMAEKLFIHRNTLLYRKNRIIEILGVNPFEMPYLFNYAIAFLILKDSGYDDEIPSFS